MTSESVVARARVARNLRAKIASGVQWHGDLTGSIAHRDQKYVRSALDDLVSSGEVTRSSQRDPTSGRLRWCYEAANMKCPICNQRVGGNEGDWL